MVDQKWQGRFNLVGFIGLGGLLVGILYDIPQAFLVCLFCAIILCSGISIAAHVSGDKD